MLAKPSASPPAASTPAALPAPSPATGAAGAGLDKSGRAIRDMFAAVARRYDLLNHLLSGGLDLWWRRQAAAAALEPGPGPPGLSVPPGRGGRRVRWSWISAPAPATR